MIIKDNMANMCAKVTSIYMEFTLAFGPKPEFSFSFKCHETQSAKETVYFANPGPDGKFNPDYYCLLYTSPSPRDA